MKRICMVCVGSLLLSACAGNPPAWWNPDNRYGTAENPTSRVYKKAAPSRSVPAVTEQTLDGLPDDSYEEITLTPMPDEEGETRAGAADGTDGTAEEENGQAPQGTLPLPSVLD